jgi:tryptophan-rich sensory protein
MPTVASRLGPLARERPLTSLGLAILAVEIVGASGAVFTAQGMDGWYAALAQPAIAPPSWVFAPVWTGLFALMGTAPVALGLGVFGVHMVANLAWSAVFFGLRAIGGALVVIGVLWLLIVATMGAFARVDRRASLLLVPYLAWVSFAALLNYGFWRLN